MEVSFFFVEAPFFHGNVATFVFYEVFPFLFLKGLGHKIYCGHVCVLMSYRFGGFCLNVQRFCQDVGSLF